MKNKLTERMEIRLTQRMKKDAVKLCKRFDISIGEVFRMSLIALIQKEKAER